MHRLQVTTLLHAIYGPTAGTVWFETRPLEPALEGPNHSQLRAEADPFPSEAFSCTAALQASLALLMSAIILLDYRPRCVKGSRFPVFSVARSSHAEKIARMLVAIRFHGQ